MRLHGLVAAYLLRPPALPRTVTPITLRFAITMPSMMRARVPRLLVMVVVMTVPTGGYVVVVSMKGRGG
jgi:hypothetical protein